MWTPWTASPPPPPPPEDPSVLIAKQVLQQAAAYFIAIVALFVAYRLFTIVHWIGDKMFRFVLPGAFALLMQITALVVNLGRIVTGITVLTVIAGLFWIYSQGPGLASISQLEMLYRFYKETNVLHPLINHLWRL